MNDRNSGSPLGAEGLIFLVGYMGCGKSTKAKQLAHRLGCSVIDLDTEIVNQSGKTIAEFFATSGESGFRDYESEILKTFSYPEKCVVATGGGLPCFFDNMDWMNANGTTVYLQMEPAQLVSRLQNRQKRPLIKDLDDVQLLDFINEKLTERNPFYTQAKVIVNAFDLDVETLEEAIANTL
ncbi:shikimate kinase [Pedobacter sp. N23S346]|uniref:shikimate kinase n=1 Tax=Pedobacter sp. N23S346 TaxID=3402750 RepID=UPI003AD3A32D